MRLPRFEYLSPTSIDEACALLAEHQSRARVMAGGTDLLLKMARTGAGPAFLVGLKRIPDLDHIRFDAVSGLSIGPLASLAAVADAPRIRAGYAAVAEAARSTATVQIRNMGTVAGNLCNASPSADMAPPLLVHGAELVLAARAGSRTVSLEAFFRGPGKTVLETEEIVCEIRVPTPRPRTGSAYVRLSERSLVDIAAVAVAALVSVNAAGQVVEARLALGAVAPTPVRAEAAERHLVGHEPRSERVAEAARLAVSAARPISDVRASAAYRCKMVEVLASRALSTAASRAQQAGASNVGRPDLLT